MIERGAIYRMAECGAYTGRPRPVVVMQNPNVGRDSVIVVPLTTGDAQGAPIRASSLVEPPAGRLPEATVTRIQDIIHDLIDEGAPLE